MTLADIADWTLCGILKPAEQTTQERGAKGVQLL